MGSFTKHFVEHLEKSSLTQPAKEAINILAQGATPSGKQVGRPDLMNIINFMLKAFECISPTHQSVHTEEKSFACSKCDQKFGEEDELKTHESDHTEEKPFKCPKCDITFSKVDDGCEHAETIIDLEMDIFSTQVIWDSENQFACSKCDKKFSSENELKTHENDHTEEKPFKCPKCDITFSSEDDGCRHAETIIDLEMAVFNTQVEWDEPKKEPTEEKPFACSKCDKKFGSEAELKTHERTHTGEKSVPICRHLKAGRCKFGFRGKNNEGKCPYRHVQKCNKFMKNANGCSDKDCKFMHPFVCRLPYLNSGRCDRSECTFAHIKKNGSARAFSQPGPTTARPAIKGSQVGENQPRNKRSAGEIPFLDKTMSKILDRLERLEQNQANNNHRGAWPSPWSN